MRNLSQAIQFNKLPSLEYLDISHNNLTGCIETLLNQRKGAILEHFKGINLASTQLNKQDVKSIAKSIADDRFCNLKYLNLAGNQLTRLIAEFFEGKGLASIQHLDFSFSDLGTEEFLLISEAIEYGKLPMLCFINLIGNKNIQRLNKEVLRLHQVCYRSLQKPAVIAVTLNELHECDPGIIKQKLQSLIPCSENEFWAFQMTASDDFVSIKQIGLKAASSSFKDTMVYQLINGVRLSRKKIILENR